MALLESTHRRKNPLTGRWVLVSPHRNNRPWLGATEAVNENVLPKHDDSCPLCPSNTRANGDSNPDYKYTHVFRNDFGALTPNASEQLQSLESDSDLFIADEASGECRVICFSPEHNKTLPELSQNALHEVVKTWKQNYTELAQQYECVQVFENKGEIMGCSQPHPHGQVWAHSHLSTEIEAEDNQQLAYYKKHGTAMLADYAQKEQADQTRVVFENEHWLVVVPFWAAWPFETMLVTKDNIQNFSQLNDAQTNSLAQALKVLTTKYDNVFNCSFPYSMGWHNAPANRSSDEQHWRLHAHFYPPLLRSATVKKHMVGYEMLGESQRDLSAETAASILKAASTTHYKDTAGHTDEA
ncbi:UDP-glucose--hexose-1-phosphate uridylyltransferase [Pseudoalteromonas sp. NZS127_1]|uniref:UDP-glucose--hexose-1-phosphate uridylyltransferase n=1 Tax=Pseudoalteromonas sp. NZS127_1 TaxID=2792074 RepID=UPI0018CE1F53|nr:UDP-glucose--hexose-1-phosphate uridylyltransferase [Pseudoalteromonas sp. NZS127_1]MBG9995802.1 UDP-glucose--hexose-1-phosphate uridylyltransferase [Pseudoalteromonas sp. NZS127_1]